ncbi:hypothetical protein J1N35_038191 [Gossypium stocksii]|uniref:Aminotransferase-like plant mobile domain-containing protein n=1 Tax=Gossypium stocksii TaxID=47602 RepID=A0A9D3ULK0_9ROSI|nr:hypothetical protein J1N35_038191 [Gossypium stocksii]
MLYHELFRETKHKTVDIGSCLILLQSWVLYMMPFLASVSHQYVWMSYIALDIASIIPPSVRAHAIVWCVNAPSINCQMVEWYAEDWVLCQFGCRQHIPNILIQLGKDVQGIDKKGKHAKNWALEYQPYIVLWNARLKRRPYLESYFPNFTPSKGYQQWYVRNGLP